MQRHTGDNGKFDPNVLWEVDEVLDWGKLIAQGTAGENGTTFVTQNGTSVAYGGTDFNRSHVIGYNASAQAGKRYNHQEAIDALTEIITAFPEYFNNAADAYDYFEWEKGYMPSGEELREAMDKVQSVVDMLKSSKNSLIASASRALATEALMVAAPYHSGMSQSLITEIEGNGIYSSIAY